MRLFLLLIASATLVTSSALAAEFRCITDTAPGSLLIPAPNPPGYPSRGPFEWDRDLGEKPFCRLVTIDGPIVAGDADKLEWILVPSLLSTYHPSTFQLQSPGGNLSEAMAMGRLFRAAHASVSARRPKCGSSGQPVCCASACAVLYFGASSWEPDDILGLHRPTIQDMDTLDYQDAKNQLTRSAERLRAYLKEMEVDDRVFDSMMRAAPDRIVTFKVSRSFPPTVDDWLSAKCRKFKWPTPPTSDDIEFCKKMDHGELNSGPIEASNDVDWFGDKTTKQLEELRQKSTIGAIRMSALEKELDRRQLADHKPRIDAMPIAELRAYIRKHFDRSSEEDAFSVYAYKRLQQLSGDRIVEVPYSDCVEAIAPAKIVEACSAFVSQPKDEENRRKGWPEAWLRRADALRALGKNNESLADLDSVAATVETQKLSFSGFHGVFTRRAELREIMNDLPGAIDDLTQAMKSIDLLGNAAVLEKRAALYERTGQTAKAAADRKAAMRIRSNGS